LCFHAQQAAEKAIKALLIRHRVDFPYVHDLAALLTLLEKATSELPESIRQAARLTRFACWRGTLEPLHPSGKRNTGKPSSWRLKSSVGRKSNSRVPGGRALGFWTRDADLLFEVFLL
jgi:HEPN domain